MSSDEKGFPMEARVVLTGLSKAPQFNDKLGIVKSELQDGRQQVLVGKKFLGLKPSNLIYQSDPAATLSMHELKSILKEKDESIKFTGMDLSDLRREVNAMEPENMFNLLTSAKAKEAKAEAERVSQQAKQMKSQANSMADMSPDQLRQQARAMRSMPPDQIRRMNPQLRNMSDAQIQQAAAQMEQMAENPEMLRMATDQMKNMTPQQIQQMQQQQQMQQPANGATGYGTRTSAPQPTSLNNLNPEQLKKQAEMMRNMTPDQIRSMNPQLAGMSDEQIKMTVNQMVQMADNPEMFEMAKSQMAGMTPEDIERVKQGGLPPGTDPSEMMQNMNGKQMKQMMKMVKDNPNMLKKMLPPGTSETQMKQMMKAFEGMDEKQLDATMKMMQQFQSVTAPFRNAYSTVNRWCGGYLVAVVFLFFAFYGGMIIYLRYFVAKSGIDISEPMIQEEAGIDIEGSEF